MKKIWLILLVDALLLIMAVLFINAGVLPILFLLGMIVFPVVYLKASKKSVSEPEAEIIEEPKPKMEQRYLWLQDTDPDVTDKFVKAYKGDFDENEDYNQTNKEILEDCFEGDKIYKYEPYELPFKAEGSQISAELNGEWISVGRIKKTEMKIFDKSVKTDLYLMPGTYKVVREDSVEKVDRDSYFGLSVTYQKEQ